MPTFYHILEVTSSATPEEIRRAYRRLSKRYHPDVNDGAAWAEERFKAINTAYTVLSDLAQRRAYDRQLAKAPPEEKPSPPPQATRTQRRRTKPPFRRPFEPDEAPPQPARPAFGLYFLLLALLLVLFLGRLWLRSADRPLSGSTPASASYPEREEFIQFYQQYPRLLTPHEADRLLQQRLPDGFTEELKCRLEEGDTAGFRLLVREWSKGVME